MKGKRCLYGYRVIATVLLLIGALLLQAPETQAAGKVKKIKVKNLPAKELTLKKGKTKKLKIKVTTKGKNVSKKVTFKSNKKKVATVSAKGKIKAKKKGKAKITIISKADKKKKVVIKLTVGTPVKKVAISRSSAELMVNNKVNLSTTVSPKKASNKKIVWTSNKKAVATVSSKGIVTGKKDGTAIITAEAADGSGKKAKCQVTVISKVKIASFATLNEYSAKVTLNVPQALSDTDFSVKKKQSGAGVYQDSVKIQNVTTTDKKNYILTFALQDKLKESDNIQVTIKNLIGTGTATAEAVYSKGKHTYQYEKTYLLTQGEKADLKLDLNGFDIYGDCSCTVTGLPTGLSYGQSKIREGLSYKLSSIAMHGTPTTAGTYQGSIVLKDETGSVYNFRVYWLVGNSSTLAVAGTHGYGMIDPKTGVEKISSATSRLRVNASGGSGEYYYTIVGSNPFGLTISSEGKITGSITSPGTHTLTVQVTDRANSSLKATAKVTAEVVMGRIISGTVTDIEGKTIKDIGIKVIGEMKNKGNPLNQIYGFQSDEVKNGKWEMVVPDDEYDLYVRVSGIICYYYGCKVSGKNISGINIKLPLYKITVVSDNPDIVKSTEFGAWVLTGSSLLGGYGDTVYLPVGTHDLLGFDIHTGYSATFTVTVPAMRTVTAKVVPYNF